MIETIELYPGISLRCFRAERFKQGSLSVQMIRPMCREEAAINALLPAVLLRGSERYPDIRAITSRMDDLYGASVGTMVQRIGDYQTTGLYCGMIEDQYALSGDQVLAPMVEFLEELLFHPAMEGGGFRGSFVAGEKKNLISAIESERNDKRIYAANQLRRRMGREDSYGIPRLGGVEEVAAIDHIGAYAHYQKILSESRIELFYVGAAEAKTVAELLAPLFDPISRNYKPLPHQTGFHDPGESEQIEEMEVAQSRLAMGFVTPITTESEAFVPMQLANVIFGGGMTSKLFQNVRERLSLCYDIGSGYTGSKGIVSVSAGIDAAQEKVARQEILAQLAACQNGDISHQELTAAKEAMLSSLRGVHDSPGAIERYYFPKTLGGMAMTPEEYMAAVERATAADVIEAAKSLRLHTVYYLKGVGVCE